MVRNMLSEITLLDSVSKILEGFITLRYIAFIICLSKPDLSWISHIFTKKFTYFNAK